MSAEMQQFLGPLLLFAVFIIFFIVLPQRKKLRQEKNFDKGLKKGDKVVTKSGLHGKLLELHEDGTCIIETGAGKVKFERSALSMELTNKENAPAKK
ncbi:MULTISPECIES: preprotein translocase subunit YajC [Altibacter]|uniref:preprotein translocase subunit YajC n=1 Tax=Altibacter TaxID=1535231 RepID=UPI000550BAD5|nr:MULTISPECIES: preprotein translocase subunit YajC [Altibacter]MAP53504.1 preprotein translocase subunit YajC [Altibacter sp.]MCW8980938.1 preprotein translocase subunit YajC [Altibacter sp.]MCW9036984.1 preprotein translocase subunit YajC [Altibacter sp.]